MGQTILTKNIAQTVSFDPDLTILEDVDWCLRAREKGFKLIRSNKIVGFDVNMYRAAYSDSTSICLFQMPFEESKKIACSSVRF